jgi:hypothetical protein
MPSDKPVIDKDGYILEGRFAGRHVSTIMQYAQTLEDAIPETERSKTPPGEKLSPDAALERAAAGRVDAATLLTANRFRSDDEAEFRAKVGEEDFTKYSEQIRRIVSGMQPSQQMAKGIHWMVYVQLRAADPEFEKALLTKPVVKVEETDKEKEAREAKEQADADTAEANRRASVLAEADALRAKGPKAAPASVPPSPVARAAAASSSKERKPKLVPNDKIRRAAREWGMPVEAYLLLLEDKGMTQDDLERQSTPREETRRRTIFDRSTAS